MNIDNLSAFSLELKCSHFPNGDIVQETVKIDPGGRVARTVSCHLIRTKDDQVRKSLIALGWTPPPEPAEAESRTVRSGPLSGGGEFPTPSGGRPWGTLEPREPIDSSYPLSYRLVTTEDGAVILQGIYIAGKVRIWASLPTQSNACPDGDLPAFGLTPKHGS